VACVELVNMQNMKMAVVNVMKTFPLSEIDENIVENMKKRLIEKADKLTIEDIIFGSIEINDLR